MKDSPVPRPDRHLPFTEIRVNLGPGEEFDRIRAAWRRLGKRAVGGGDDCAILTIGDVRFAVSSDLSVEGTHFKPGWMSPAEIGYRATTASLSDLAAVAATPAGVLISVGISSELAPDYMAELMEGVGEAVDSVGAHVWGGDTVRSDRLIVDVMVIGTFEGDPVLRRGAQAGDALLVTGRLGGPAVAIEAWVRGCEPEATARDRFVHPMARVAEAQWLQEHGATALIDISDGLIADASHVAAASGVSCVVQLDTVPLHGSCEDSVTASVSGEEYELLVAVPGEVADGMASSFMSEFDLPLTRVGDVEEGKGIRVMRNGEAVSDLPMFRHF